MIYKIIIIIFLAFSFQKPLIAQESGNGAPRHEESFKSKRKQAKADRKQAKEDRKNKKAEEKRIRDHHKRIQTKEVQKRMKRSKVKAQRNHDNKRDPFFQRVFKKKRGKASKKPKEKTTKLKQ